MVYSADLNLILEIGHITKCGIQMPFRNSKKRIEHIKCYDPDCISSSSK
ncbi:hypothetical protein BN1088_120004 [Sphingobacterium sp. PM2-P1-29]|nr:hypothetical protein BN1088_120004 [Sphingobacterium sp. PM2-P1-29]